MSFASHEPIAAPVEPVLLPGVPAPIHVDPDADADKKDEKDKKGKEPRVGVFKTFQYADKCDNTMMVFGGLAAFCAGAGLPAFAEIFGRIINELIDEGRDLQDVVAEMALYMVYVGLIVFFLNAVHVSFWMYTAQKQISRIKGLFFASVLRQDISWHDEHKPGELTARMDGDTRVIQNGINDKFSNGISQFGMFLFGFGFGFYRSWELTLVMIGTLPLLAFVGYLMSKVMTAMTERSREGFAKAGEIATEVLENVRTVQVFGREEHELERFSEAAKPSEMAGIKREFASNTSVGLTFFVLFCSYAIAFYFSSYLVEWKRNNVGEITSCFFSCLMGSFGLGFIFPSVNAFEEARSAAYKIYNIIDRTPSIDIREKGEVLPNSLTRSIEFCNVKFSYPTRKEHALFKQLNATIKKGTTVAFSGASGTGKSSIIQMIQRFYDPDEGEVRVDGIDLRKIDLSWWRDQIGIVSQEPNLFSGTIKENVLVGKQDATDEEIIEACKKANIHDLILSLPQSYDTPVGSVGSQLSGGQKQRIAIARAIVKNPKILILDEATSALDRKSEVEVQAALDKVMNNSGEKLTVIVIAHRLTTIRNADVIHFITTDDINGSHIAESGTFDQLLKKKGLFAAMCRLQGVHDKVAESSPSPTVTRKKMDSSSDEEEELNAKSTSQHGHGKLKLEEKVKKETEKVKVPYRRLLAMNKENCWAILLGLLGSCLAGVIYPVYAVVLGNMLDVLGRKQNDIDALRAEVPFWAGMFVLLASCAFIGWICQSFYAVAGERLTKKLRTVLFRCILRQDQAFFDMPGRDPGALSSIISGDCEAVHQLWGPSLGFKFQMAANLIGGIVIAFYYSWKLALVIIATTPVLIVTGAVQQMLMVGFGHQGKGATVDSIKSEALSNIRTVVAFNLIERKVAQYKELVVAEKSKQIRNSIIMGVVFGFTQFSFFGMFALSFWYGGKLINEGELEFKEVLICTMAVLMGGIGAGEAGGFASKLKDAEAGAKRVFLIVDREPPIDPMKEGEKDFGDGCKVVFKDVEFIYPARPDVVVLKKLSVSLRDGTSNGLMGQTGCGKSTTVQLLARFYNPDGGRIEINGRNICDIDLRTWRSHLSIVLQEPSLFSGTVRDNIRYSRPEATDAEIEEAARLACIHDDVMTWPQQYDTDVGYKGRALSGGQKQRVAIARGLLRRPRLLLLDEATSALDNATEGRVMQGINKAIKQHKMTVVSVAHRLTTIQSSDRIILLDEGRIVEQGSHAELMALGGEYKIRWELYQQGMS